MKNIALGGEDLFLSVLKGPDRVYLQGMDIRGLAGLLLPYLPARDR